MIGALGIPAFQQLTGMNSLLFYSPVIFQSLGFGSGASLYSSIITGSMLVVGALVSMSVVDRLGRRFLFMEAGIQMIGSMVRIRVVITLNLGSILHISLEFCSLASAFARNHNFNNFLFVFILQVVVAITLALKFGTGQTLSKGVAVLLVIAICLFVVAYGWAWGPLGWLVPSELFPLEARSAGQSVVVSVNLFFTAAIAQCFLAALCHLRYVSVIISPGEIILKCCTSIV